MQELALLVLSVCDAEYDRVALVALHGLKVLYEEGLLPVAREELLEGGVLHPLPQYQGVDEVLLGHAERHDPHAPVRVPPYVLEHQFRDPLRLRQVRVALPVEASVHMVVVHAGALAAARRGGEGHKLASVEMHVGEGYQLLIAAAVVPAELALRHGRGAHVEYRLEVRHVVKVLVSVQLHRACEEVARRHLLGIADDDELLAPVYRPHRVLRKDLGGLVEDHRIKADAAVQEHADAERGHQEAGLEQLHQVSGFRDERPDALLLALLFPLAEEDRHGASRREHVHRRALG